MIDLGPRAEYILACYIVVGFGVCALGAWLAVEGARLNKRLVDLEARGGRRRGQ